MPEPTELALQAAVEPDPVDDLSDSERAFVEAYIGPAQWKATEAARLAGYTTSDTAASWHGWYMLRKPNVRAAIEARVRNVAMEADELLVRLGAEARLDLSDFAEVYKDGPDGRRLIDWPKVKQLGLGPFIKAIKQTKYGESLELIDTQRAKEMIGRALGLFADRLRVEGQIDYSKLTDDELKQLAAGKRPSTL